MGGRRGGGRSGKCRDFHRSDVNMKGAERKRQKMAEAGDREQRSNNRKRHHILQKRVNDDELSAFKKRAGEAGFPDHKTYLEAFILGKEQIERSERTSLIKALGELGKHGSNLNQIAYAINSKKISSLGDDQIRIIEEARKAVSDVAQELREALQ